MRKYFSILFALVLASSLVAVALPMASQVEASPDWWDTNWQYRQKLSFLNSGLGPLTNFPVLVKLSDGGNIDYGKTKAGGADIRFVDDDDATELAYEIEDWNDASGDSWIWVKVPTIDDNDIDYIYMYYGNPAATDDQNPAAVWNPFVMVQHMKDDPDTSHTQDSTLNNNDGTKKAANEPIEVDGWIAKGQDFDGTDDCIKVSNDASHAPANVTLSIWVNFDVDETNTAIISRLEGDAYGLYERYGEGPIYGYGIQFFVRVAGTYYGAYTGTSTDPMKDITIGNWHHFAGTYDGDIVRIYLDGVEKTPNTSPSGDIYYGTTYPDLLLGADPSGTSPSSCTMCFDGQLDEVRISDTARSDEWIMAQYFSMTDDYIIYGAEKARPLAVGGEVYSINKVAVLMPWLGLAMLLALGAGVVVMRRRQAH